jgi:hypothetical protein
MLKVSSRIFLVAAFALLVLIAPAQAESTEEHCWSWHYDPLPSYTGPVGVGIGCEDAAVPVLSWTVPESVTTARFYVFGADDAIRETGGGTVEATLDLSPGSTITFEIGDEGEASAVRSETEELIVAAGGNELATNYASPSAREIVANGPGPASDPFEDGGIIVEWTYWYEGEPDEETTPPPEGEGGQEPRPEGSDRAGPQGLGAGPQLALTSPACVVPRLRGLKPVAARRALAAAHCVLGRVSRRSARHNRRGRIIRQASPAGTVLPLGTPIEVVVGRRP